MLKVELLRLQKVKGTEVSYEKEHEDLVMHGIIKFDQQTMMFSDQTTPQKDMHSADLALSLNFDNLPRLEEVFAKLSDGDELLMPLKDTFWNARLGQLKDNLGSIRC